MVSQANTAVAMDNSMTSDEGDDSASTDEEHPNNFGMTYQIPHSQTLDQCNRL